MYRKSIVLHTGFSVIPSFRNTEGLGSIFTDKGEGYCTGVKRVNLLPPKCESVEVHR